MCLQLPAGSRGGKLAALRGVYRGLGSRGKCIVHREGDHEARGATTGTDPLHGSLRSSQKPVGGRGKGASLQLLQREPHSGPAPATAPPAALIILPAHCQFTPLLGPPLLARAPSRGTGGTPLSTALHVGARHLPHIPVCFNESRSVALLPTEHDRENIFAMRVNTPSTAFAS